MSTSILSEREVTNLSPTHQISGYSDDNINLLMSDGPFFDNFPRNLGIFLSNLSGIAIYKKFGG